jgi:hypothetical protein
MDDTDNAPPKPNKRKQNPQYEIDNGLVMWGIVAIVGVIFICIFLSMLGTETEIEINTPITTIPTTLPIITKPTTAPTLVPIVRTYVTVDPVIQTIQTINVSVSNTTIRNTTSINQTKKEVI